MNEIRDLIEDWIAVRAVVGRHVMQLKTGRVVIEGAMSEDEAIRTRRRLERLHAELNALLKEHAGAKVC